MNTKKLVSLLLTGLMGTGAAQAAIFHCGTAQDLQTALSLSASDGQDDTIYLAAGIYYGNFTFNSSESQALTLSPETNAQPGQVVLSGTLSINSGSANANLAIQQMTVQNGGLTLTTAGTVTFSQCTFQNCSGGGNGGAFTVTGASTFNCVNTLVSGNSSGGCWNCGGGWVTSVGQAVVTGCTFTGNNINGGWWYGGTPMTASAIFIQANSITFTGNNASANTGTCGSGYLSGAVYLQASSVTVSGNTFQGNTTSGGGAGLYLSGGPALLTNCRFVGNSSGQAGGGVNLSCSSILCQGNTFLNNSASSGGAIQCGENSAAVLADNLVVSNSASSSGGGIYINSAPTNYVVNNTIFGNSAQNGGGLYYNPQSGSLNYVDNNIIWGNTASSSGGDVFIVTGGTLRSLYNNDYHSMAGLWDVAVNNIDVAPLFVDQLRGNYRLRANSLCINAGNNSAPGLPLVDLDGNTRIADDTVDIGAFEQSASDWHPADVNTNWTIEPSEFAAYASAWTNHAAWSTGPNPIPIDYVTRAGFLVQTNGGNYQNVGGGKPLNWQPR